MLGFLKLRSPELAGLKYAGKSYKSIYDIPGLWVMNCEPSKLLDEAAYDVETATLLLNFKNQKMNSWYAYSKVPIKVWVEFSKSESKGQYFLSKIKDKYDTYKI